MPICVVMCSVRNHAHTGAVVADRLSVRFVFIIGIKLGERGSGRPRPNGRPKIADPVLADVKPELHEASGMIRPNRKARPVIRVQEILYIPNTVDDS